MNLKKKIIDNQHGQTTIEYILILALVVTVTMYLWSSFSDFLADSFGNFNHELSMHLSTGSCAKECFFLGYANGKK